MDSNQVIGKDFNSMSPWSVTQAQKECHVILFVNNYVWYVTTEITQTKIFHKGKTYQDEWNTFSPKYFNKYGQLLKVLSSNFEFISTLWNYKAAKMLKSVRKVDFPALLVQ